MCAMLEVPDKLLKELFPVMPLGGRSYITLWNISKFILGSFISPGTTKSSFFISSNYVVWIFHL